MTEEEQIMKRCQAGTRNYEEANNLHAACYGMIGKLLAQQEKDYERGVIDGMQKQMQSSVDKAVNRMAQPEQEPVAWRAPNWGHGDDEWVYRDFDDPVLIADGKPSPNNEALYTTPPQRPRVVFPTMLRKMWSGGEVQAWLDENVNKEKNT